MGEISITVQGSFRPNISGQFSAMHGGHARAVADAITWLSNTVLPDAIRHDHDLQTEGAEPENGFGEGPTKGGK